MVLQLLEAPARLLYDLVPFAEAEPDVPFAQLLVGVRIEEGGRDAGHPDLLDEEP